MADPIAEARAALAEHDQPTCGRLVYGSCTREPSHLGNCSSRLTQAEVSWSHLRVVLSALDAAVARAEQAEGWLADVHRRVGRGDLGSARRNFECILSDLVSRDIAHAEELAELR